MKKTTMQYIRGIEKYVREKELELREEYGNNFTAMTERGVIDSDKDVVELVERIHKRKDIDREFIIGNIDGILGDDDSDVHLNDLFEKK